MKESLQYLIGVDKRNPNFTIFRNNENGEIHVYLGAVLYDVIQDKKDNPELKLMLARLYNAGVKVKSLIKHFGYSYPTIQRWGEAVKSGDPEKIYQALSGQGAVKKITPEIKAFIVHEFSLIYPRNKRSYSQEIRKSIKDVYAVELCGESLRPLFGKLKEAFNKKGGLTEAEKKRLFKEFLHP